MQQTVANQQYVQIGLKMCTVGYEEEEEGGLLFSQACVNTRDG